MEPPSSKYVGYTPGHTGENVTFRHSRLVHWSPQFFRNGLLRKSQRLIQAGGKLNW